MLTSEGESVAELRSRAGANPATAESAVRALLSLVSEGELDESLAAAMAVETLAESRPAALAASVDELSAVLYYADDVRVRRALGAALAAVVEEFPEKRVAARGLSEATRIRSERFWNERPLSELGVVRHGFDGLVRLAEHGHPVPGEAVGNAVAVLEVGDLPTVLAGVDLLERAVVTESDRAGLASDALVGLLEVEDGPVRERAAVAVARTALRCPGHVDEAERVAGALEATLPVEDRDVIETAVEALRGGEE